MKISELEMAELRYRAADQYIREELEPIALKLGIDLSEFDGDIHSVPNFMLSEHIRTVLDIKPYFRPV